MTSKYYSKNNYENGTYSNTNESYNSDGVVTYKRASANDGKTYTSSTEYYYDDGSLRYKTSNKEVTDGNKTTVTGDRYNRNNELVFAISGTRTTDENGNTSRDLTYTDASGAKVGWDKYDAKTGKVDSKLPYNDDVYTYGTNAEYGYRENEYNSSAYADDGNVKTWREYSYDPATGKRTELVTNYKGLKIFESTATDTTEKTTDYWLRSQAPYITLTTASDKTTVSYQTVKGLELKKSVAENGVEKFYNSKGELTYQRENGVTYVNKDGKLEKLEDGLGVMTSNRYNVTGLVKYESIDNGYKDTYYDLDKKVTGSHEWTSVTKDNTTTETSIDYDENGKVTEKNVYVTKTEKTDKSSKTTKTKNGMTTNVEERVSNEDGSTTNTTQYYDEDTGLISYEYINTYGNSESTWTSKNYDSQGNLYSVYKEKSQANGWKFQQLDGNNAVASYGTDEYSQGFTVTEEYWAVGSLRRYSMWDNDGLSMPGVYSAGATASLDENGGYTYWGQRDANGNEKNYHYYEGDVLSNIEEVIYNDDGSRSTHWENYNKDGTISNWYYKDETEDGLYTTERDWDGTGALLWTKVTEATKEGQTSTTTDPYGNKVVEKEDYATGEYTIERNYTGTDGWKYAFGGWKYIENGEETYGWKNIGGTWYYFEWDDMAESNIALYEYDEAKDEEVLTETYVIAEDGSLVSNPGWYSNSDGLWSYVLGNGQAATGWQNIGGSWYYFNDYGYMRTGNVIDEGYTYHMADDGTWITLNGWLVDDNDGRWKHYTNDVKDTGWFYDGGWYYLSGETGSMVTNNLLEIDDEYYFFDENGLMATGWQQKDNAWYYLQADGTLADGWINDGGAYYYMTEDGMATGWQAIDGNWEYFNADGTWSYTWGPVEE